MTVSDFRCLPSASVELDPLFTLISGPNASGKTSLLEAAYVLGRGRSFRTRRLNNLVRDGAPRFVVFGEADRGGGSVGIGVEGTAEGLRARVGGQRAESIAILASILPVQIIDPEIHRLIEEGPSRRRRFLDWGLFHVEPGFVQQWRGYQQVLRQRNAALKASQPEMVSIWDSELIKRGEQLSDARGRYVSVLSAAIAPLGVRLLGADISLSYRPGWGQDRTLAEALRHSAHQERQMAVTLVGPQRADLAIRLGGVAVRNRISRGQQKLVAAALLLAQLRLFLPDSPVRPTLLLDDPAAELDDSRLSALIREVASESVQLIVTTLNGAFPTLGTPGRRYQLVNGSIHGL